MREAEQIEAQEDERSGRKSNKHIKLISTNQACFANKNQNSREIEPISQNTNQSTRESKIVQRTASKNKLNKFHAGKAVRQQRRPLPLSDLPSSLLSIVQLAQHLGCSAQ